MLKIDLNCTGSGWYSNLHSKEWVWVQANSTGRLCVWAMASTLSWYARWGQRHGTGEKFDTFITGNDNKKGLKCNYGNIIFN